MLNGARLSLLCLCFWCFQCLPTGNKYGKQVPSDDALKFMKRYGYLVDDNGQSEAIYSEENLSNIIKNLQRFGAIEETGFIDNRTLKLMSSPRCGVPDILPNKDTKRKKRYAVVEGWNKRHITYYISNWSPKLGEEAVARNIQKALDIWGGYGRLTFTRSSTPDADIIVAFGRGYHGDRYPFDGPGMVLGHAFFPSSSQRPDEAGDIHFDDDETWVDLSNGHKEESYDGGTDFFTVALHELGHSLGLSHSAVSTSVMFPYYKGWDPDSQNLLDYDDILGMYTLYIQRRLKGDDATPAHYPDRHTTTMVPYTPAPTTERPYWTTHREREETTPRHREREETTPRHREREETTPRNREREETTPRHREREETTPRHREREETTPRHREREETTPRNREREETTPRYRDGEETTRRRNPWFGPRHPPSTESPHHTPTRSNDEGRTVWYEGDDESVDDHKGHDPHNKTPKNNSPSLPYICHGHFDAVATLRGELFIFKDEYLWRLKDKATILPGYPTPIRQMFPDLPKSIKKIDAAYQRPDGNIVLFTGNKLWIYNGSGFVENSPLSLSYYDLPDYLDSIDAVQNWAKNGKTYFYKRDRFWRYDETTKTMDPGYPMHMERWRGVPTDLDAAMTWKDGVTYFFKGDLFWKFDNNWIITTETSPLPIAPIWLGCKEEPLKMKALFGT